MKSILKLYTTVEIGVRILCESMSGLSVEAHIDEICNKEPIGWSSGFSLHWARDVELFWGVDKIMCD